MICENCKKEISKDSKFCVFCGTEIEVRKDNQCPNCGKEFDDVTVFCTNCGEKVEPRKGYKTKTVISEPKTTSTHVQNIITTVFILLTITIGLLASTTPVIMNNANSLNTLPENINLYSVIEFIITENNTYVLMNIIPALILCATNITIIICFTFTLIKCIQIFSDSTKSSKDLNKILSVFIVAFLIMYFVSIGYVVNLSGYGYFGSEVITNPLSIFTIMLLVGTFVIQSIYTISENKKNNISNQQISYKIISFVLLLMIMGFTANSFVEYSSEIYFANKTIQFHPVGYLVTTYWKVGHPTMEVGVYATTESIFYAWIYFISYCGLALTISLKMANALSTKEEKNSKTIATSVLLGIFGLIFFIIQMVIVAKYPFYKFNGVYTGFLTILLVVVLFNIIFVITSKKEKLKM